MESRRIQKDIRKERVRRHFDELAEVSKAFYEAQQFITCSYEDGETSAVSESEPFSGIYRYNPCPSKPPTLPNAGEFLDPRDNTVCVDSIQAVFFFEHFRQEFPELGLKNWRELLTHKMPQSVIDRFRYLGNTSRFEYCPSCEVCWDVGT